MSSAGSLHPGGKNSFESMAPGLWVFQIKKESAGIWRDSCYETILRGFFHVTALFA
jgi:hypothetical protein